MANETDHMKAGLLGCVTKGMVVNRTNRLPRIEALLAEAAAELALYRAEADPLALALAEAFPDPFRAAEAWALAEAQAGEAQAEGLAVPPLPRAIRDAGISDANALGRWIGKSPLFEKCGSEGGSKIWVCRRN